MLAEHGAQQGLSLRHIYMCIRDSTYTALAQLVAEELDCDWTKVSAEFASPNEHIRRQRIWGSMSTGGSMGVRSSQDYVRRAGASARQMLVESAAAQWQVPARDCTVANGVITHEVTGRTLRYGQLATDAAKQMCIRDRHHPGHRAMQPECASGRAGL